ncbi:hypothetical protein THIOM_004378 [Candidatus Thiomargarita nelsonii]|uniref:Uncharacterized protein n=1 Tax=Candidatus Thiomargarita nelsonii TaxID=1003181 RepID=A0A0A6RHD5_9GAMM|nr:hypothetical protein THIOM_004378 [Candidatus Thiomargarita nelsonii]
MIDKRFRKEEFEKCGNNSPRGEALLTELNIEILNELDKTLRVKLEEIASKLNQLGHQLDVIEVEDVAPGVMNMLIMMDIQKKIIWRMGLDLVWTP